MATHPYISGAGNIAMMVNHLRKSFPQTVNSETVKRLGIASNNESYVINALQFVGIIDTEGKKTQAGTDVFSHHRDDEFAPAFGALVKSAYKDLFDLYSDEAWTRDKDDLITFFRRADSTSAAIGMRQANTFQIFAALSGYGEMTAKPKVLPKTKSSGGSESSGARRQPQKPKAQKEPTVTPVAIVPPSSNGKRDMALTVRIEINLPAEGSMETYDNIFKSIRANLMDE